jgi:superfamily II DNA helicase RecQ
MGQEWPRLEAPLRRNLIDVLLISPERLANDDFVGGCLLPIANRIGLFVVDATANDRVVRDIDEQLGPNLEVQRAR